jgi:transcriptional antiterminator NusG
VKNGISRTVIRQLLPGYVFFSSENPLNSLEWKQLSDEDYIYKPLSYGDGTKELSGSDLSFVQLLLRNNGLLDISKAVTEGSKARIIDGPLKELEGQIVKVNKRRRCAELEVDAMGIIGKVWLSFELLEETGAPG